MNIKILTALHKEYPVPVDDLYLPIQVGSAAAGHFKLRQEGSALSNPETVCKTVMAGDSGRLVFDDDGENISSKNKYYCELTALYWGWKNLDCEYLGLVHYRRYLKGPKNAGCSKFTDGSPRNGKKWDMILTGDQARQLISQQAKKNVFVILPKKRRYYIETLYSHYAHSHYPEDLNVTEKVIREFTPEYADAYRKVMNRRSSHMFNMCIMRKDILDAYCSWLFYILQLVEERLDISKYSDFDKRVFGRISELLLDVWLTKNNVPYCELPLINLEGEKWAHKILLFLRRKIRPEH